MGSSDTQNEGLLNLTPDVKDAIVDIIFVHGLTGDRKETWTKSTILWPETILAKELEEENLPARILTWGYNSAIGGFWTSVPEQGVEAYARNLLADLSGLRDRDNNNTRPILFVMHSLGGIVCKSTFLLGKLHSGTSENQIEKCTRGMLFLGTPHAGSSLANWANIGLALAKLVKLPVNDQNIETLETDSRQLKNVSEQFNQLLGQRVKTPETNVEVACFYEELPTKLGGIIVSESSATLSIGSLQSISADHKNMCKFTSKDDIGYQRVSQVLKRWVKALSASEDGTLKPGTTVNGNVAGDNYGGIQVGASVGGRFSQSGFTYNTPSRSRGASAE